MTSWVDALPSETVRFLTTDEALAIHALLIERYGGRPGIRDAGLLESALFRPQTGYYGDLIEMAAALMESLLINHPFIDGNKRMAFFATDVFLRLNGFRMNVETDATHDFIVGLLESGQTDLASLRVWIRDNSDTPG